MVAEKKAFHRLHDDASSRIKIGIGGARWVTNEVDKKLLTASANRGAATQPAPEETMERIDAASPAEALAIAQQS